MGEKMSLEKAAEFMRLVDNGQISGRISEWVGLREACGVIHRHLTQPAQAVDVGAIREVIAELSNPSVLHAPYVTRCADKLTAALTDANGKEGIVTEPTAAEKALVRACEVHLEKIKVHELAVTLLVTGGFLSQDKYDQALDIAQQFLPKKDTSDAP